MADSSPLAHSPTLAAGSPQAAPGAGDQLPAGTPVGDYVIERFIGAGAMGEVYAGLHPVIGKRVAIKILRHELAASAEAAERFIREARAVNQIDHENVVDVFAFGRLDDGRLYLAMDLVEGRSLRAHLVDGPLPVATALEILDTIADALDAAHARGVVHRDLKPDNIVLADPRGDQTARADGARHKVMVLDFGIAKLISKANEGKPTGPGTLTGAGTWLGTPGYMAPEQWSVDGAGPASDRYALGVIAFELLAGAPPFTATSVPAMMEQHFRAQVPALSTRGAVGVPVALDKVLEKALAKDPEQRFGSARALVEALRLAAGPDALRARGAVAMPASARKLWVPALAGVGLLGGAIVVVVLTRSEREPTAATRAASSRTAPPVGSVSIDVLSTPTGAEVRTLTERIGATPLQHFALPGDVLELEVRKPGYVSQRKSVTAGPSGTVVQVSLAEVTRFQGTWRLSSGELRHFARRGDEVDIFKLREVAGAREFYKTYRFELATTGVAFGGEETVIDPRAPSEPTCHVRMRVDYHYDPMHDVLEQRREKVNLELTDGKCIVQSRKVEPALLARVDDASDTHEIAAPVGNPILEPGKKSPVKKVLSKPSPQQNVLPLDPKAAEIERLENAKRKRATKQTASKGPPNEATLEPTAGKQAPNLAPVQQKSSNVAKMPPPTYTSPTNASSGTEQNLSPTPQAQIIPQPKARAPLSEEPIPQAAQQAPQQAPVQKQKK